jgi:hypothetical protein
MEMAIQNFSAALRMSMPEVIRQYVQTFRLQKHLHLLTAVSRLRRLPRWLPMRPHLARAASRRLFARLSTVVSEVPQQNAFLLERKRERSGEILLSGVADNGNGEGSILGARSDLLTVTRTATGNGARSEHEQ